MINKKTIVVDTNVAVVANGHPQQASLECKRICVKRLESIEQGKEKLVLDSKWQIVKEYTRNLSLKGQSRPGDVFLKWAMDNIKNKEFCELVNITPLDSDPTNFKEFPQVSELSGFDPSDRKFIAVSMAHSDRPSILQAVDSLWWEFKDALERNGVNVEFICESDIRNIYDQRTGR
jgi:hypothetical protein